MDTAKSVFDEIAEHLLEVSEDVSLGKMMSSPGIKYKGKVFAYYDNQKMGFRLGKAFNPQSVQLVHYTMLSPFKTKPPLDGWFVVSSEHMDQWDNLARLAMQVMMSEMNRSF